MYNEVNDTYAHGVVKPNKLQSRLSPIQHQRIKECLQKFVDGLETLGADFNDMSNNAVNVLITLHTAAMVKQLEALGDTTVED